MCVDLRGWTVAPLYTLPVASRMCGMGDWTKPGNSIRIFCHSAILSIIHMYVHTLLSLMYLCLQLIKAEHFIPCLIEICRVSFVTKALVTVFLYRSKPLTTASKHCRVHSLQYYVHLGDVKNKCFMLMIQWKLLILLGRCNPLFCVNSAPLLNQSMFGHYDHWIGKERNPHFV